MIAELSSSMHFFLWCNTNDSLYLTPVYLEARLIKHYYFKRELNRSYKRLHFYNTQNVGIHWKFENTTELLIVNVISIFYGFSIIWSKIYRIVCTRFDPKKVVVGGNNHVTMRNAKINSHTIYVNLNPFN